MTVAPKPRIPGLSGSIRARGPVRRAARILGWGPPEDARAAAEARGGALCGGAGAESPESDAAGEEQGMPRVPQARGTGRRGLATLWRSPLARRIVAFNLVALVLLVAGMLWLMPSRDALAPARADWLVGEAILVARVMEARLPSSAPLEGAALAGLDLRPGVEAFLFDVDGRLVAASGAEPGSSALAPAPRAGAATSGEPPGPLSASPSDLGQDQAPDAALAGLEEARALAARAVAEGTAAGPGAQGRAAFTAAAPVRRGGQAVGAVAVRSEGEAQAGSGRAQVLPLLALAAAVSVGLSLVLASTIANPLADLVAAAEAGRSRDARSLSPGRVRIPDLADRPDEIGRLSAALRGMVAALYDRIDLNEQFAADVAHEIKNPLASLRSAVGTLRVARREDQRETLLGIIEHDVRRLDRLVSDISSASRLDSDLVKEEEAPFDLIALLSTLSEHLGREAKARGIDLVTDLPREPIVVRGLEGRLAQVVVNVVGNAISLCDDGDAVRVWVRKRESRVLVVVEDTGPGIPEEALAKIFERFYSQRPEGQFGNNSGLGLAISKQIVEAHGGVIWAENIHPTDLDPTSEPMGARFVVGLPV